MMKRNGFRFLLLLSALLLLASAASADVFVGQEKPADWEERDLMKITVFETTYNDAIIITQGGHSMMIDGGTKKFRPRIAKYLADNGLDHMDLYFNSHPHDDHLECASNMIALDQYFPEKAMSAFPETYRNELHQKFLKRLKEKGIPFILVSHGDEFTLGDMSFKVYRWPEGNDPNELSAILLLRYRDATMLLPGDLTGQGQKWLANTCGEEIHADILKVPHHGLVAMPQEFITAVNPSFAVFTSRLDATKACTNELKSAKIPFMHHSKGTIFLETDGTDWYISQVSGAL